MAPTATTSDSSPLTEPLLSSDEPVTTSPENGTHAEPADASIDASGRTRQGTISSACFNMWSTMVGGGCLSLPLAFAKSGNVLGGPLLLLVTAVITRTCFRFLVDGSCWTRQTSYEGIATVAFGRKAYHFCTILVTLMCFFGIVGYAVLLRDMLQPITDHLFRVSSNAWPQRNALMFLTVLLVTPLCTLRTLTALEKFGAASMSAIGALGLCVVFRSGQCLWHAPTNDNHSGFQLFPKSWKDVLDVIPLFISCYVCHYNIPAVLAELRDPSPPRVSQWLSITVMGSTAFYTVLGVTGSIYALRCHSGGVVDGNILLDFPEDDPLVLVGRLCLAVTITLAFPMLTIPARDILIRSMPTKERAAGVVHQGGHDDEDEEGLDEPFLEPAGVSTITTTPAESDVDEEDGVPPSSPSSDENLSESPSLMLRLGASLSIFWTGAALASCVASIDIVWDLLGSSLSILLSFLIPFGSYLSLSKDRMDASSLVDRIISWVLLLVFTPLMFISTGNAIYNTFFR